MLSGTDGNRETKHNRHPTTWKNSEDLMSWCLGKPKSLTGRGFEPRHRHFKPMPWLRRGS
jgi:hypothetical protein